MNHQAQIDSVIAPALEALQLVDGALPGYFIMAPGRHVPPPPGFPAAAATAHVAGTAGAAINPAAAVLVQITPPGFPPAPPLPLSLLRPLTLCMYNYLPPLLAPTPPRCRCSSFQ